jgi:hypothetical protein
MKEGGPAMPISVKATTVALALAAAFASPASATGEPRTRLVSCETGSCLLVTGRRADAALTVAINGHAVSVQGARRWRTSLPLDTVRAWSAPHARSIIVSIGEAEARASTSAEADLPIGLLGHAADLTTLVVTMK